MSQADGQEGAPSTVFWCPQEEPIPFFSPVSCSSVPADSPEAGEQFEAADFGCHLQVLVPGHPKYKNGAGTIDLPWSVQLKNWQTEK